MIFGGAGFIGHHLANYLLESRDAKRVVLADINGPTLQAPQGTELVFCDVRKSIVIDGEFDLAINLAAVHRTPGHPDHEYHETNESGAMNVTEFASERGIGSIWFASSIAVYGPGEGAKIETSTPAPVSAYGKSKLAAERIHEAWAMASSDRKLTIARPATVFGKGEGGNFTRLAGAMRKNIFFYPGRRDTLKACGYVKDLGPAFDYMEQFANPTALFNFAYPAPPTIEEICRTFAATGSMRKPIVRIPAGVLLTAGRVLKTAGLESFDPERIKKLMISTNVHGSGLRSAGFQFSFPLEDAFADWSVSSDGRFD